MVDNDIVKEVAKHLPLKDKYQRYTEHEYFTRLPFPTSDITCKKETFAHKNEIWYFGGWNVFTILFGDCNTSPFQVVKLGEVVEDVTSILENNKDVIQILFELDEGN